MTGTNRKAYQVFSIDPVAEDLALRETITPPGSSFMGKYGYNDMLEIGVPQTLIPSVLNVDSITALDDLMEYCPVMPLKIYFTY